MNIYPTYMQYINVRYTCIQQHRSYLSMSKMYLRFGQPRRMSKSYLYFGSLPIWYVKGIESKLGQLPTCSPMQVGKYIKLCADLRKFNKSDFTYLPNDELIARCITKYPQLTNIYRLNVHTS